MKKFICIHGHFYQPPRENPWTGEVDEETSAAPFHDWNERIAKECYEANTRAAILNPKGEVSHCVNNFETINFDINPTLLSWLKQKNPITYKAILEADRLSVQQNRGHGNAIAQVYNHIILPLAKKRDKVTQVYWGIVDFEYHFKRKPEGMWLSEAAVDRESLKILSDHGIRYTILAPHQAKRVRRIGFAQEWRMLHHEAVDPKQPYRMLLEGGKQFHIYFYDGPVSRAIGFQGLLHNGDQLVYRLMNAFSHHKQTQLVSTATDGETFGHHHKFGEMAVAYAVKKIREQRLAHVVNYADYLDRVGSSWEADIYQNSSWSCAHGVQRWRADCGCRMRHEDGWNQKWRTVLRDAMDWLQERVDEVYEVHGSLLLKDPWAARNDYIRVILDPGEEERRRFLSKHGRKNLNPQDEQKIWRLLEAEKFSLFMFTSCGWFFDDISGIEPVQMMKFAARAAELVQPELKKPLEEDYKNILAGAKSNLPEMGTGKDIFEKFVRANKSKETNGKAEATSKPQNFINR